MIVVPPADTPAALPPAGLLTGADGRRRCAWAGTADDYRAYHDDEWGRPQGDPARLFEKLCLEGFQSGLSWLTILRKRENFRRAFAGFDSAALAGWGEPEVARLLADPGIVRHRAKIEAALWNAARATRIAARTRGGLAAFLWGFAPAADEGPPGRPGRFDHATLRGITRSPASTALAEALRAEGWKFIGPTTAYAFMQATGMVNDHIEGCWCRGEVTAAQRGFRRP